MNQNDLFMIEGLKFTHSQKVDVIMIPQAYGLKLLNPIDLSVILNIYSYDEGVMMDWNDFYEGVCCDDPYFLIQYHTQELKISGTHLQLDSIHDFSSGKFIFKRSKKFVIDSIKEKNSYYQVMTITNRLNGKKYNEKRICSQIISQEMSNSFITDYGQEKVPEELRIMQLLNMQRCPYIMQIHSFTYDGDYYSIIYPSQQLVSLKQILKKNINPPISFIIDIAEQLLIVLTLFSELKIIHNGINLENIHYSQQYNSIVICNFSFSTFESQNPQIIKGNSIGFIPPEQFLNNNIVTTQANTYQLGVLLYYMLFNENPFGKEQVNILQNNISGKYQIPNTNIDKNILEVLKSMLQKNPTKRRHPKEYLLSKIFQPQWRSKISKNSFLTFFVEEIKLKIDEYEVIEEITNVQELKNMQINKRRIENI